MPVHILHKAWVVLVVCEGSSLQPLQAHLFQDDLVGLASIEPPDVVMMLCALYLSAELPNEEAKTQMRHKINEYMVRAEYLRDWTAEQARKQPTQVGYGQILEKFSSVWSILTDICVFTQFLPTAGFCRKI
ncbi:hypothetical protein PHYPSEUDO_001898 [Phytophthora pseudosyringae]|uniref:Uncharacterized protein n=1 Tax=Phytophthora pseudosyringae TaxID=221518 RepID=A0A8T1WG76_9STRA|nr:hypothetical protein PHYPSEUDO_001898 [Phytophthora pseudosyringae]